MTSANLAALRTLDPNSLSELVQRTTGQPELRVSGFTVKTLSSKGVMNPEGLCCLNRNASKLRRWGGVLTVSK